MYSVPCMEGHLPKAAKSVIRNSKKKNEKRVISEGLKSEKLSKRSKLSKVRLVKRRNTLKSLKKAQKFG